MPKGCQPSRAGLASNCARVLCSPFVIFLFFFDSIWLLDIRHFFGGRMLICLRELDSILDRWGWLNLLFFSENPLFLITGF